MTQYKITSADFISPTDTGEPDAYIDPADPVLHTDKSAMLAFIKQSITDNETNESLYQVNIIREEKFDGQTNRKRIS